VSWHTRLQKVCFFIYNGSWIHRYCWSREENVVDESVSL